MKRPVTVFEYWRPDDAKYDEPWQKRQKCKGMFLEFGVSFEEFEDGAGNYSTAIIELDDGAIINPAVDMIRFDDKS